MKNLIIITLALIAFASCQKKPAGANAPAEAPVTESTTPPPPAPAAEEAEPGSDSDILLASNIDETSAQLITLDRTYLGDNLALTFPDEKSGGHIKLLGDDAKKMFDTLVTTSIPVEASEDFAAGQTKIGVDVLCDETALKEEPENKIYSCTLVINYKLGSITELGNPVTIQATTPRPAAYSGQLLSLSIPAEPEAMPAGLIELKPKDSKVLFSVMTATAENQADTDTHKNIKMKTGQKIKCIHAITKTTPEKSEFACFVSIENSLTGAMEALSAPSETEPEQP